MIKPIRKPQEFGFKSNDSHLVANSNSEVMKAFNFSGNLIWELPALMEGQHNNWKSYRGDTPPGLYKLGEHWNDYAIYGNNPPYNPTVLSYGWITFDMVDLEGNEDDNNRSGISLHGGGTMLGFPGCWQAFQPLLPTWGCIRMHNSDLVKMVLPLFEKGTVFVSVFQ